MAQHRAAMAKWAMEQLARGKEEQNSPILPHPFLLPSAPSHGWTFLRPHHFPLCPRHFTEIPILSAASHAVQEAGLLSASRAYWSLLLSFECRLNALRLADGFPALLFLVSLSCLAFEIQHRFSGCRARTLLKSNSVGFQKPSSSVLQGEEAPGSHWQVCSQLCITGPIGQSRSLFCTSHASRHLLVPPWLDLARGTPADGQLASPTLVCAAAAAGASHG